MPATLFVILTTVVFATPTGPHSPLKWPGESVHFQDCDSIPDPNKGILDFVSARVSKKVGRGECWDLAAEALTAVKAKWNGIYEFGRELDYTTECIFPGDIVQFEGVRLSHRTPTGVMNETMQHHTAIIYEVKSTGKYIIAHQNTSFSGRRVGLSELDLSKVVRGKIKLFRPVT